MSFHYKQLNVISDSRGVVFEPLETSSFSDQKNAHIVISVPGIVRGNHYHVKGKETIVVKGPALVRTRKNAIISDVEVPETEFFRFIFPPGVSHAIKNLSKQPNMLIAFNTVEHDPQNPDTVKDMLL